jgi:CHRD domain
MNHKKIAVLASAVAMTVLSGIAALAVSHGDKGRSLSATLRGIEEPPSVITGARGQFKATISNYENSIEYELSFENLQANVTQAHIHVGQKGVNGGISVWLCGTETNPGPAGTPVCPASGTVTGTITANTVVGPAGQGVAAGEFEALLQALRSGVTYANVHSAMFPGGEIRGQISVKKDDDDHHRH